MPTVTVCTDRFESFAREKANALKAAQLPLVSIPHPISGRREDEVAAMASQVLPELQKALLTPPPPEASDAEMAAAPPAFGDSIDLEDDLEVIYDYFSRQGWADGLPIIPPTPKRVHQVLKQYSGDPFEVLGKIPHLNGEATVERCAVAMVMAGCLPSYLPVVLTAVRAMMTPAFNIQAVQSTTNAIAPLLILNGPVITRLGFNCTENVFGQGNRANATVGRAIRFILLNIGGADPGKLDRATHGHPGKYSYCVAENEAESPWEPFHVDRGFRREDSVVTVVGADAPMNINDASSTSAEGVLHSIASSMITPGSNNALRGGEPLVVFSPEHADLIARDGWSKADVRAYLYEHSQIPLDKFSPENRKRILLLRKKWFEREGDKDKVALADSPESIKLLVTGGPGKHSLLITNFGNTAHASRRIYFSQACEC
ncbi:MAG: hypothetical protein P1P89_13305 [Desulfobacterales bacterium]|nr:hypothetical protein [Desulfobacterales bacterium]